MITEIKEGMIVNLDPELAEALSQIDSDVGSGPFTVNGLVWVTSCTCGAAGRRVKKHDKNCPMSRTSKRPLNLEVVEVATGAGPRRFTKESLLPDGR